MLADDICQLGLDGYSAPTGQMQPIIERIRRSQKYSLAPQFTAVADALAADYGGLVRAFPFCRLPYLEIWIELAQNDRHTFAEAGIQAPLLQSRPSRVGFLCRATREDLSAWKAHLFWKLNNPNRGQVGCNAAAMATDFDLTQSLDKYTNVPERLMKDDMFPEYFTKIKSHPGWERAADSVKLMMLNHTRQSLPDYGFPDIAGIALTTREVDRLTELMAQLAASDWAGECAFLLAVVGLMNARNATEIVPVQMKKLNHARAKRRKLPLFEHHILKIHPRQERRASAVTEYGGNILRTLRQHMVAGHWKVRKSGIFFWHPHLRGKGLGYVHKDYEVT